jgi:hypothetical protein
LQRGRAENKKGAKLLFTTRTTFSADGKVMTVTTKGTDADGKSIDAVRVFDKAITACRIAMPVSCVTAWASYREVVFRVTPRHALRPDGRPPSDLRDAHTPVRLTAHRDLIHSQCRIQAGSESVSAPLVCADARNVEVLTDFQFMNSVGNLAVRSRLLDTWTEIGVLECDAVSIAA